MLQRRILLTSAPALLLPVAARAQPLPALNPKYMRLFTSLAIIGNGADLTADTLVSYTIPASTLLNVGDGLHIVAAGGFTGSTDTKVAAIHVGPSINIAAPTASVATNTNWRIEANIMKSAAANAQQWEYFAAISGGAGTQAWANSQSFMTDTGTLAFTVTGQNTTNSVASSVTVRTVTVDLIRA